MGQRFTSSQLNPYTVSKSEMRAKPAIVFCVVGISKADGWIEQKRKPRVASKSGRGKRRNVLEDGELEGEGERCCTAP